jgi:hypothetical protein
MAKKTTKMKNTFLTEKIINHISLIHVDQMDDTIEYKDDGDEIVYPSDSVSDVSSQSH